MRLTWHPSVSRGRVTGHKAFVEGRGFVFVNKWQMGWSYSHFNSTIDGHLKVEYPNENRYFTYLSDCKRAVETALDQHIED